MPDLVEKPAVKGGVANEHDGDIPTIEQMLKSSNWEDRLAEARRRREIALAEKRNRASAAQSDEEKPLTTVREEDNTANANIAPVSAPAPEPVEKQTKSKRSVAWLVTSCAVAGLGVALGAGYLIGKSQSGTVQPELAARGAAPSVDQADPIRSLPVQSGEQTTPGSSSDVSVPEESLATLPAVDAVLPEVEVAPKPAAVASANDTPPVQFNSNALTAVPASLPLVEGADGFASNVSALPAAPPKFSMADEAPSKVTLVSHVSSSKVLAGLPAHPATTSAPRINAAFAVPDMAIPDAAFDSAFGPDGTNEVLAFAPVDAVLEPSVGSVTDVETAPAPSQSLSIEPKTLSAQLGLVGDDLARVNVRLHAPDGLEGELVDVVVQDLEATGFVPSNVARPNFKISKSHLRYYNAADFEVAQAIASELNFDLRDFTSTKAPEGLIEVWLQGGPAAKAQTAKTTRRQTQPRRVNPVTNMRNNLANRLRNGDHL